MVLVSLSLSWSICQAGDVTPPGICRFAVALPELEGPLTLGIFSAQGDLVRLLYWDTPVESIPSGLNGLLISWDGKDDGGTEVPDGSYRARGLVHGALKMSALPEFKQGWQHPLKEEIEWGDPFRFLNLHDIPTPCQLRMSGAQDALYNQPPLITITAKLQGNQVVVAAEGLPLLQFALASGETKPEMALHLLGDDGMAELTLIFPQWTKSYILSGLDHLVPLDAGTLEMPSDTLLSTPEREEKR